MAKGSGNSIFRLWDKASKKGGWYCFIELIEETLDERTGEIRFIPYQIVSMAGSLSDDEVLLIHDKAKKYHSYQDGDFPYKKLFLRDKSDVKGFLS